ncbi:ABC transporter substrate-binding protein [Streptomyces sp. GC420]|nr:ABC transporter substrate-binding protein [Streptomyces sp. GC420]
MGMSDDVLSADPASGYDPGSWLLFNNVFQPLLSFPKGSTTPEPEAAESCGFKGSSSKTYQCVLKDGLKFTNGNTMTSKDVKFSFERVLNINDPDGPAVLLNTIDTIETPDEKTVVFHLKVPDATFPGKIASGAGSIVDHREYDFDKLRTDGKAVGSGVYKLDSFTDDRAAFSVNAGYKGTAGRVKNSGLTLKFFHGNQEELVRGLKDGDVDFAYRGLAAKDIAELENSTANERDGLKVIEGTGAEVQHLVFNMAHPVVGKPGVRKAMAYLINRDALIDEVYESTATSLYSIVPSGITGHTTAFFDTYGGSPNRARAEAALRAEGITEKVRLTLWATPIRYGPGTVAEFEMIAQQLNESGLFDARVKSVELPEYEKGIAAGKYAVYVKGWVPDYPDPDNFTAPFFGEGNVLDNRYDAGEIVDTLIPAISAEADRNATTRYFTEVQDKVAEDLPVLPLWQSKQYAVAKNEISGLEWTLDISTIFRFWEISKG